MTSDGDVEPVRGSGNLSRDLEWPNPEASQLKSIRAGQVLKVLGDQALTARKAQELTGIDYGNFSRVWRAKLDRFTVDHLIAMLEGLGPEVEVSVDMHVRRTREAIAQASVLELHLCAAVALSLRFAAQPEVLSPKPYVNVVHLTKTCN